MTLKPLLILPPILIGLAGFFLMTRGGDEAAEPRPEPRLAARVLTVAPQALTVRATGYGRVEPAREWDAVSEAQGRVVAIAPGLAEGVVVEEGAELVAVETVDYELALQKARANRDAAKASLAELDAQARNTERSLALEERILTLAQADFDRASRLAERGTGAAASRDASQRALIAQELAVARLRNTLDLLPAQRAALEATLAARETERAQAQRALARTVIRAPYRGRVSSASVSVGQFIRTGETLLTLQGAEAAEVVAEIQPQAFAPLARAALGQTGTTGATVDAARMIEYLRAGGVTATVRMNLGGLDSEIPAELVRFGGAIDARTGAVGVAVRLNDPLVADREAARPPLPVGAFVAVTLESEPVENLIAIPRAALRRDDAGAPVVYLADASDRLDIRPVQTGAILGEHVVITDGLAPGDRLLLSEPRPPAPGLLLDPVEAEPRP